MNTTLKSILKWIVIIGLFATPFIVFIVTRSMLFPFITGKGFTFRILTEIVFACWLLLAIAEPMFRPKWNYLTKSILVFLGIVFLADCLSKYPYKSFWSNYERMEGFVTIIHLVMYYFVLSSMFTTSVWWRRFWNTNLFASVGISMYGLLQLMGKITVDQGGVRLDATLGNSSYLAIYMVFAMFIGLMLLYTEQKKIWKWIYGAIFVLDAVVLYYTATRGAILGFVGGIILAALIVAWKSKDNPTVRKISAWVLGVIVLFIIVFVSIRNTPFIQGNPVLTRFTEFSLSSPENQGRSFVWPMAIKGALQRPVLGWGQESFNYVFNANYNPAMYTQEQWFDRTHDIALDWLINAGVLGLLSYISIFAILLYMIWKKSPFSIMEKSLLTGLIAGYVFNNIFVFDNITSYLFFFAILAWISSLSVETSPTDKPRRIFSTETIQYFYMPVIGVALIACVYFVNIPAIEASYDLIQAISPQSAGLQTNLADFNKVFAYNSFGTPEALEQLVNVSGQVIGNQQADTATKQAFYNLTDKQIQAQIKRTPQDARYLLLSGSFYNNVGQYATAIPYLTSAIQYSPGKPALYFELASSYVGENNMSKAFDLFTQGYNLEPRSPDSQIIYAVGAIYAGKPDVIKQMFGIIGQNTVISDDRILQAYVNTKNFSSAESILTLRLSASPTNYNTELELASVYANAGDKAKAIQLIKDVEAKNPSLKSQLDPYITQLSQ